MHYILDIDFSVPVQSLRMYQFILVGLSTNLCFVDY